MSRERLFGLPTDSDQRAGDGFSTCLLIPINEQRTGFPSASRCGNISPEMAVFRKAVHGNRSKDLNDFAFFSPYFSHFIFATPPIYLRCTSVVGPFLWSGEKTEAHWRHTGAEVSTDVNRMSPAPVIVSLLELCINVTARGIRTYSATLRPPAPDAPSERTRSPYSRSRRRHTPYPVRCATRSLSHRYLSAGRRGNSTCRRRTG